MSTPKPRDGSTVIQVAVQGIPLTWVGPPLGVPGKGNLAGDGSPLSRQLVKEAHEIWEKPILVDHPSWKREVYATDADPIGVLATLLHLGEGRGIILEAPQTISDDLFMSSDEADIIHAEPDEA